MNAARSGLGTTRPIPEMSVQALWFAGALPGHVLRTQTGAPVEIIDPGTWNRGGGPDFLGAELRIDGVPVRGHVEVHCHVSDWRRHGHDRDPAYRGVVLHVVLAGDPERGATAAEAGAGVVAPGAARTVVIDVAELADLGAGSGPDDRSSRPDPGDCRAGLAAEGNRDRMRRELLRAGRRKLVRRAERLDREAEVRGAPVALLAALARSLGQPANAAGLEAIVGGSRADELDDASQSGAEPGGPSIVEARWLVAAGFPCGVTPGPAAEDPNAPSEADEETGRYAEALRRLARTEAGSTQGAAVRWQWGGTRPAHSPWRRLAGLAALTTAFGGPSLLLDELIERLWGWLGTPAGQGGRGRPPAELFVRRDGGYWARRARPGPAGFARPHALIGPETAGTLARDVLLPLWLGVLLRRGPGKALARFWRRVEGIPPQAPDGVLRFVAARMGEGSARGRGTLFPTWLHQVGARWYYRSGCAAGRCGCLRCPLPQWMGRGSGGVGTSP